MPADAHNAAEAFARAAAQAAPAMARADGATKNAALHTIADALEANTPALLAANAQDAAAAAAAGLPAPMVERLTLTPARIRAMAEGARQIASLPDPVGEVLGGGLRPNGLRITRVRTPLGAILIIFESRPNVTVDAAGLCLKSGNACILRGGKECVATNRLLGEMLAAALAAAGLPGDAVQVVDNPDRAIVNELLGMKEYVDLVVPRGGKGLIAAVAEHSRIPVLKHLDGICHTYVDATADPDMAVAVTLNAKTGRPSTCNATETLLVHRAVAEGLLPRMLAALAEKSVEIRADAPARVIAEAAGIAVAAATEEDWSTEYNDLILSVKVVDDLSEAIAHINRYGSKHTDAIITNDVQSAERFKREVDSASVMVNASTRFADGFEYGLGAEIGISTDKLHARGPVGLEGLTTYKWVVEGSGQVRK